MNKAKELLDQGRLSDALAQQTLEVRARPADVPARIFLFELLCFSGDFGRAEKHLEVVGHQSAEMLVGVEIYLQALAAEKARRVVFAEDKLPSFLTAPPDYATFHLEALKLQRDGEPAKARILLEKALTLRPALRGEADGHLFDDFEDWDPFLGPFLELIINDKYAWLPFEQIRRIEIAKPRQLRDLI
jgi:type VI secretion system protein ImpE